MKKLLIDNDNVIMGLLFTLREKGIVCEVTEDATLDGRAKAILCYPKKNEAGAWVKPDLKEIRGEITLGRDSIRWYMGKTTPIMAQGNNATLFQNNVVEKPKGSPRREYELSWNGGHDKAIHGFTSFVASLEAVPQEQPQEVKYAVADSVESVTVA